MIIFPLSSDPPPGTLNDCSLMCKLGFCNTKHPKRLLLLVATGFPRTLENLENEKICFQAWKSPGKIKKNYNVLEKSWKFFKNTYKVKIEYFVDNLFPPETLFPQIVVIENLNFDLEKSWKSP